MKRTLVCFMILAASVVSRAQEGDLKPVANADVPAYLGKIQAASLALSSLQCSFMQEKEIAILSEKVMSKGTLLFKKPDKLRWEYQSPYFYLFAMNGDRVYVMNDKSTKQFDTKSNALFKEISLLLVSTINGAGMIDSKKFDAQFFEKKGLLVVKLTPRDKTLKGIFKTVLMFIDKTTYLVSSVQMTEPSGDRTTIVFGGVKLNQAIADEAFVVSK